MGRRGAIYREKRGFGYFLGQVIELLSVHYSMISLHKIGLTGAFLFASTTARNSNALLGWNCGYAFSSNVGFERLSFYTHVFI